jgi:ACR3 family arsenite efflux pump ArsB
MHKLSSIFFLVAVAAWSLSFVFGILARNSSIKLLAKSVVVGDMLPMISGTQEEIALAFKTAEEYITESDFVINRYRNLQLLLLLFGAFGFMISIITSSPSFGWLLGDLTL